MFARSETRTLNNLLKRDFAQPTTPLQPGHLSLFTRPMEVKVKSFSHVQILATPWTIQSMEFSMPEYWSG